MDSSVLDGDDSPSTSQHVTGMQGRSGQDIGERRLHPREARQAAAALLAHADFREGKGTSSSAFA
jgi:hypothetical protein